MDGACDPEILITVVTSFGVLLEESLADIYMDARKKVVQLQWDCEAAWIMSLGKLWPTNSLFQQMECSNSKASESEVPNIYWIVAIFPGIKKDYRNPDHDIKQWAQ